MKRLGLNPHGSMNIVAELNAAGVIQDTMRRMSDQASWCLAVQRAQDNGHSWAVAVKKADEELDIRTKNKGVIR